MGDELAKLSPQEVAGFYSRLANEVDKNKGALQVSLAADLMRQWLAVRTGKYVFNAPTHLSSHADVMKVLKYHRAVYLTEQKASFTGGISKWAGIIPRIQGKPPHPKWNMIGVMNMEYQSLVEIPLRYQITGSDADRDILYALHGFQLKTNVSVTVAPVPNSTKLRVNFTSFQARVIDRYDWDYSEHLTVPNPDYKSTAPGAVAPDSQKVTVYHSNARRVENANLAAPYDLETNPWNVTATDVTGPGEIDPSKSL
ncbi:MAG: hypothetical protein IT173_03300 [Acidobacteria bacterium]|nr:hypothetical protein [Acidobacteriota bacterium]